MLPCNILMVQPSTTDVITKYSKEKAMQNSNMTAM